MKKLAVVFTLCAALLGCQTTEQALKESGKSPLSAAQIEQALAGHKLKGTTSTGRDFTSFYGKDGKIKIFVANRDDTGSWRVTKSNTLCTKYTWIRNGAEKCGRLYKLGKEYQRVDLDGSASSKFKIIRGNPQKS